MPIPRYSGKELTRHLRELAAEAEGMSESGDVETKARALAALVWKKALGYKANEMRGEAANRIMVEVEHPPEAWAIQLIWNRLEGKEPQSSTEEGGKISAAEKVGELARDRVNTLATRVVGAKPPPPKLPRKAT
jgi:hypothetical protein